MSPTRLAFLALTACGRLQFDDASRDAGTSIGDGGDGGTIDGAAPGIDCHVNHAAALFCDGFEDGMTPWGYTVLDQGTVGSTTTRAWGGTHALEAQTNGSANYKAARWGTFLPNAITSGDYYVREYLWLASSSIDEQVSVLVTGNGTTPFPSTFLLIEPTGIDLSTDSNAFPFLDVLPRDRWVCVEMHIHIDPTAGFVRVTFDGASPIQTPLTDTDVAGGYTQLEAGVHYATANQGAISLWVDDVVADTSPIGCD